MEREKLFRSLLEKKKVDPCYLQPHNCISQLFGASINRITAISSQKNRFTAIWNTKQMDPSYLYLKKKWFTSISGKKRMDPSYLYV